MKYARSLLIFNYGLFSIANQTLLFREFVTTFEGNDISIGFFFGSWFVWVGLGALLVYRAKSLARFLLHNIELLFLVYIPAFILQLILIIQAREIAGIESYMLWSVWSMFLSAIVINAPVSLVTGLLFPTACRWITSNPAQQDKGLAVSNVYILEAAGSFIGGLGVTILLGFGVSMIRIFFVLVFILASSVLVVQFSAFRARSVPIVKTSLIRGITFILSFLIPLAVFFCLFFHIDRKLLDYTRVIKWTKLLPKDAFVGSFQTAQAEYLYGVYQGQWIAVRDGSVVETLPDESSAGQIAAISLSQKPDAKQVLVIGSGLGLCYKLLELPQIEGVTWSYCDSEYVNIVDRFIPPELRVTDSRLHILSDDIRYFLSGRQHLFDIVILNLPDATNSILNRYYTLEFYDMIKRSLQPDGILAVRLTGGENIMGTELVSLGASTKLTLGKVFSRFVMTPGEETWFIASDSEKLTGDPAVLRDRFASIKDSSDVFSPQALLSIYLPDRAKTALKNYASADLPENLLLNRDDKPLTHLYSLLLTAKQSGTPLARFIKILVMSGPLVFFIPVLVLMILWFFYMWSFPNRTSGIESRETSFDSSFLVFSTGLVGIGVMIVLMYIYQTRFGSLYLHIGIVSSLFMVGLTAGAILSSFILKQISSSVSGLNLYNKLLFAVVIVQILILALIALWDVEQSSRMDQTKILFIEPTHLIFAAAFFICGLCSGCYFPIAAGRLANIGFESGMAGSKLEAADHIGASVGGMVTSLVLVPVLGTRVTLFVFIALVLANVPPALVKTLKGEKFAAGEGVFEFRRLGYILFGVAATIVFCSNLLAEAAARLKPALPVQAAHALAGQLELVDVSSGFSDNGRAMHYFKVLDDDGTQVGYIFSSDDLAPEIRGYGGKLNLAVYVDTNGRLIDFHIISSNETPSYLELLTQWRDSLKGHLLFNSETFADVDTVTGATISSNAILSLLKTSGLRFAKGILDKNLQYKGREETKWAGYLPDVNGIYLIVILIATLFVIYRGGFWSRLTVLTFNLGIGGIWLNAQYSSEQIASTLSLHAPAIGLSGTFLLAVGIPLVVILFGNIYCGYICPFGALQELLGYIIPRRFKKTLTVETMRKARFFKYIILFVLISVFFISRSRTTLAEDPLISFFSFRFIKAGFYSAIIFIIAVALTGSIFYTRFWCRYLCPAGAFLSLLNNLAIFKRYLPVKRFGKCEFGLTPVDNMDCLYCDKCRYDMQKAPVKENRFPAGNVLAIFWNKSLLVVVVIVAGFLSAVSLNRFSKVVSVSFERPVVSSFSGGQPRDIDVQRVRTMIQDNKLSDKEAEFYKKVD